MKENEHWYTIEGKSLPSVTTILKKFAPESAGIKAWKNRTVDWETSLDRSAAIGTVVHYRIASFFANKYHFPPQNLELKGGVTVDEKFIDDVNLIMSFFKDFVTKHELIPDAIEEVLWHRRALYAGTMDKRGIFDKMPVLIDWKTSAGIYPTHLAQIVAYKRALLSDPRMQGHKDDRCMVVSLSVRNGLQYVLVEDEVGAGELFWDAFDAYQMTERPATQWIKKEEW